MALTHSTARLVTPVIRWLDSVSPLIDFTVRFWVANVFWKSGVGSLKDWGMTVDLFTYEFHVPLLSPPVAAVVGTGIELIFPVFLALGLAGRFSAGVLFIFNIVAVVSYPGLSEVGLKDHIYWGILLLVSLLHGPGKISIDHYIRRKWMG